VIGCGLIGKRRAEVVRRSAVEELVIVADIDEARVRVVAEEMNCLATTDWQEVVARDDVDIVVVSTTNNWLAPISIVALQNSKHVLVEKPMARNLPEAEAIVETWRTDARNPKSEIRNPKSLAVGFNHRHHPAIWKAHELCIQGAIGPLMFIRAVYGHGGRPGYDKEWRANPELSGGGELLDQGVHIVDLCRWFLGDFAEAFGFVGTYFWDLGYLPSVDDQPSAIRNSQFAIRNPAPAIRNPKSEIRNRLEDNAFALLRTADGRVAQFHTSWTQWKNNFTFEVFGRNGYVRVDGLGGSYGTERLEVGRRRKEGGAPDIEVFEFPGPDLSWQAEWQEFTSAIHEGRQPLANGEDGLQAMRLIAAIYGSTRTGQVVRL
jgi:predicted dehydrogenase